MNIICTDIAVTLQQSCESNLLFMKKKFLKYKLQYHNPLNENLQQQKMQFLQNSNDKGFKENCW